MEKMRVLQFITPAGFYGAERWVLALANNIDRQRVTCDLAVTRESDHQDLTVAEVYPQEAGAVHYLEMSGRFDFRVVSQLCRVIRERRIDVIHTHGYKSDILGLLAAKKTGIACVSTPHGFPGKVNLKLSTFIKIGTHMLRYFDAVAPLSEELVNDVAKARVTRHKIRFIRNGVDLTEVDAVLASLSREDHLGPAQKIGYIGQMIPRKGLADLISAFDTLYQENQALTLELVGDGSQREELEAQARTLPSSDAIQFAGFRSDRLEILRSFSLFVMTSSLEGIPRCLMEAMAAGVPVVAYDIPGVDQLVQHAKTGMLAPHGDKKALADCCRQVLYDPELAASLAKAARKHVEETYSGARMAREYESLFFELTGLERTDQVASGKAG